MYVAAASTALSITASVLAAYAIVRLLFKGAGNRRRPIFMAYLCPVDPVHSAGLGYSGLRLVRLAIRADPVLPTLLNSVSTWLLMGYFKTIPFELEECAMIDGATRWQIRTRIVLPLAVPGPDLRFHLLIYDLLERVHLCADVLQSTQNKTVPVAIVNNSSMATSTNGVP